MPMGVFRIEVISGCIVGIACSSGFNFCDKPSKLVFVKLHTLVYTIISIFLVLTTSAPQLTQ